MSAPRDPSGAAREIAGRIAQRVLGVAPSRIEPQGGGLTNVVFAVESTRGVVIVRMANDPARRETFERGARASEHARGRGIPAPRMLATGVEGSWAYAVTERVDGTPATHHPDPPRILGALGTLAARIHEIATVGYGHDFGWRGEHRPNAPGWRDFLHAQLDVTGRLAQLREQRVIAPHQHEALAATLAEIERWDAPPALQHGDLRVKNVLLDAAGEIVALLDWDLCVSSIGPHWDVSVALHDLSIDAKQAFLAGYGMPEADVRRSAPVWRLFNVLNYAPELDRLLAASDHAGIERLRTRLSGALDLFAVASAD